MCRSRLPRADQPDANRMAAPASPAPGRAPDEPAAARAAGAGPGDRRERLREGRDARRGLAAAELAPLRLGAKIELDRGGGGPRPRRCRSVATSGGVGGDAAPAAAGRARTPARCTPSTASIFARTICRGVSGAVAMRSGASSPEMASQARPPASCPAAITRTGTSSDDARSAVAEAAPQQEGRRQQIEHLHQGLRHQPGIAPQQRPFLAPQRLHRGRRGGTPPRARWRRLFGMFPAAASHSRRSAAKRQRWRR